MKKKVLTILLCGVMVLGITGCGEKKKEQSINDSEKNKIEFFCDGMLEALDLFYSDDDYEYYFSNTGNYILYNNQKISFHEALDKKIITISDIDEIAKTKKGCQYHREQKEELTNDIDGKTCEYIRTYRFIDYYDYDATVLSNFFIIVDQYQMDSPMIIELNNNFKNTNFVKGENYEFTFKDLYSVINTTDGNAISKKTNIVKVEHTNKGGMDQIQNPCILN